MRSILLPFAICMLLFPTAHAQDVQKCCGTSNSTFLLGNLSTASHSQCLYTPADLSNATTGDITRIYYRYGTTGQASGNTLTNFMVRMTQTPDTLFAGGNTFFTGLDTLLVRASHTIAPGTTGDWFVIELDTPFPYDPSLTLVVDLSFTGSVTTNFGTLSTNRAGRKLYWSDLTSPTGESVVTTWQDIGFDLAGSTAVWATMAAPSMHVFPNPAADRLWLSGASAQQPYQLLHADGRLHRSGSWPAAGLPVHDLAPGPYLLRIDQGNHWLPLRFIKE